MNMKRQLDTSNIITNIAIVLSGYGGLYIGIINFLNPEQSFLWIFCNLLLSVFSGALLGKAAVNISRSSKTQLVHYDKNRNILLKNQKLVYTAVIVFGVSYLVNSLIFEAGFLNIAMLNCGLYILGLSIGLYDHTYNLTGILVYSGLIPVALSSIYLFVGNRSVKTVIWGMLIAYIFCSLFAFNRLNLSKNLFRASDINIKDSSGILKRNLVLVIVLSTFSIILILISRYLKFIYNWLKSGLRLVYSMAEKITLWIYKKSYSLTPEEEEPLELLEMPGSLVAKIIITIIGIILIVMGFIAVVMIVKHLLNIRLNMPFKTKIKMSSSKEYEEEVSFEKGNFNRKVKHSKQYTRRGLARLSSAQEKIRYLYGYLLERLYLTDIPVTLSSTPDEILCLIEKRKKLKKVVYKELTNDYIYVRYGFKKVNPGYDYTRVARKIDKDFN